MRSGKTTRGRRIPQRNGDDTSEDILSSTLSGQPRSRPTRPKIRRTPSGPGEEDFTNSRRVGWRLKQLRLSKRPGRLAGAKRGWVVTDAELTALLNSYGMSVEPFPTVSPHQHGIVIGEPVVERTKTVAPAAMGQITETAVKMVEGEV